MTEELRHGGFSSPGVFYCLVVEFIFFEERGILYNALVRRAYAKRAPTRKSPLSFGEREEFQVELERNLEIRERG